jgi:hypothetical protein
MENVPKNRDRERMDAVLDWGMEGWRLAHLLTHRLSTLEPAKTQEEVVPSDRA